MQLRAASVNTGLQISRSEGHIETIQHPSTTTKPLPEWKYWTRRVVHHIWSVMVYFWGTSMSQVNFGKPKQVSFAVARLIVEKSSSSCFPPCCQNLSKFQDKSNYEEGRKWGRKKNELIRRVRGTRSWVQWHITRCSFSQGKVCSKKGGNVWNGWEE